MRTAIVFGREPWVDFGKIAFRRLILDSEIGPAESSSTTFRLRLGILRKAGTLFLCRG